MDVGRREQVSRRARNQCEYCGLPQEAVPHTRFHIEHIIARQHGGSDDLANLALACNRCNLHKGPNLTGIDPAHQKVVQLYNPRRDTWSGHFMQRGSEIVGLTPTGRATVQLLNMNAPERQKLREALSGPGLPPS